MPSKRTARTLSGVFVSDTALVHTSVFGWGTAAPLTALNLCRCRRRCPLLELCNITCEHNKYKTDVFENTPQ